MSQAMLEEKITRADATMPQNLQRAVCPPPVISCATNVDKKKTIK